MNKKPKIKVISGRLNEVQHDYVVKYAKAVKGPLQKRFSFISWRPIYYFYVYE